MLVIYANTGRYDDFIPVVKRMIKARGKKAILIPTRSGGCVALKLIKTFLTKGPGKIDILFLGTYIVPEVEQCLLDNHESINRIIMMDIGPYRPMKPEFLFSDTWKKVECYPDSYRNTFMKLVDQQE